MIQHPVDQIASESPTVMQRLALEPVKCVDCGQYVPLGWIEYGTVKCPNNIGATGVQYGHRAESVVITNVKDVLFNRVSG